jgi:predicted nucleotidyltransferase component of viral defense system
MNEAIQRMIGRYELRRVEDYVRALREIIQEIALLGLWRSKFFERAALYGGTALRVLYGMDRYSEDLDFSLLKHSSDFDISLYSEALKKEVQSFGFDATVTKKEKRISTPIQSAILKIGLLWHLKEIGATDELVRQFPSRQVLKVRIDIDTAPTQGFETEIRFLLQPIPFSVKTFVLSDMFASKMHAILCRRWKSRVKGRDWYDLVWFAANHPRLNLVHLEMRMSQGGHLKKGERLTQEHFIGLISKAIEGLDVNQARKEVEPFAINPEALKVWSKEFFYDVSRRIVLI